MFIDPHIHTLASPCGKASLNEIIRQAIHLELDAICITDHDQLNEVPSNPLLNIFAGEEISSYGGHILAYGIQEPIPYALDDIETIELIHDQGGIAIAAHPYRRRLGRPHVNRRTPPPWSLGDDVLNLPLDGIETLNGGNQHHENRHAHKIAKLKEFTVLGGSDAHRIQNVGVALTYCKNNIESIDDFLLALKHKQTRTLLLQQKNYFAKKETEVALSKISSPFGIESHSSVTIGLNLYFNPPTKQMTQDHNHDVTRIWNLLLEECENISSEYSGKLIDKSKKLSITEIILLHFISVSPEKIIDRMELLRRMIEREGKHNQTTASIGIVIHPTTKNQSRKDSPVILSQSIRQRTQEAVKEAIRRGGNQINIR